MKYLLLSFLLTFLWGPQNEPVIEWLTPIEHDFGDIVQGKPVTVPFRFKNITDEPMVIDNVRPTCGCTALEWSEFPIEPDSVGIINIEYNASKVGYFRKKVKVYVSAQRKAELIWVAGYVEGQE